MLGIQNKGLLFEILTLREKARVEESCNKTSINNWSLKAASNDGRRQVSGSCCSSGGAKRRKDLSSGSPPSIESYCRLMRQSHNLCSSLLQCRPPKVPKAFGMHKPLNNKKLNKSSFWLECWRKVRILLKKFGLVHLGSFYKNQV